MTKITRVRAWSVAIPLDKVTSLSNRVVKERHYGLVEVTGDDGVSGIGARKSGMTEPAILILSAMGISGFGRLLDRLDCVMERCRVGRVAR